ncbi:MAG: V-type ATP synthase subunit E [Prolixibacteraceae bacterium]|jgi:V/A-type H+-transporting ATPase subunit E|nr:V-type ATP synthase subunit E [Prolixibacteraceae bacterium]
MDQKLKELTEKLFNEGVSKGNEQANQIIADANQKSDEIIANAEAKAKTIVAEAEKKAADLDKNTKSELQLASGQMVNALEQEITNLVNGKIVTSTIKNATNDTAFIQQLILAAVTNWAKKQDLLVVVSPANKKEVESYFASQAKNLLDKGLTIKSANNIKAGFQVGPADGSYKVSFTQSDFIEFFKEFISPKVVELLFNRK